MLFKRISLFIQTHKISLVGFGIITFVLLTEMGAQQTMVSKEDALPGREEAMQWTQGDASSKLHYVKKSNQLLPPFPEGSQLAMFGMGCFWGAEKKFWQQKTVYSTSVGYAMGYTKNPTYQEVCTGRTGHNEVVQVVYEPSKISYQELLKVFWENHNPTQGNRQGNDVGTQYRSGIYYYTEEQKKAAQESKQLYEEKLVSKGHGRITTEIIPATDYYYAEEYHQQYLAKNPNGYCGMGGTGVSCPIGLKPKEKSEL